MEGLEAKNAQSQQDNDEQMTPKGSSPDEPTLKFNYDTGRNFNGTDFCYDQTRRGST